MFTRWMRARGLARTADEVAAVLRITARRSIPHGEELQCEADGRACRITLQPGGATVWVELRRNVVPLELRLDEASAWGPQMQEAWESGEATQTGDLEFDLAFMVHAAQPDAMADREAARRIEPSCRAVLLALRPRIRDVCVRSDGVTIDQGALGRRGSTPSPADVQELIARGITLAEALEAAS